MRSRVWMDGEALDHVVSFTSAMDNSSTSLCGKSPWPGRWAPSDTLDARLSGRPLCVGCANVIRRGRRK